ncbi:MAG TPA: LysR family transcriptional regulator [Desulfuromonadales bacterium]|nr:LysR family transcriptional regulator [Desulfuromonadales bacterium]
MLPDLNRLKVFACIYAKASIVDAARQMNITQSAVSQQLKKLERELKTPLFTRLPRRLVPTAAADELYGVLQPFFQNLEDEVRTLREGREHPAGNLRVGAPVEFGKTYFPGIIASFRREYPDVSVSLSLGDPSILIPALSRGELDFAMVDVFLTQSPALGDLSLFSIRRIVNEEVILAGSQQYCREKLNADFSLESLLAGEFITYRNDALALRNWFRHHFKLLSPKINIVFTVDSLQAVISGIEHHIGLGIVASHLVYDKIQAGNLVPVATGKPEIVNRISLVQLQDKVPNLTEKTFLRHMMREIKRVGVLMDYSKVAERIRAS